MTTSPPTRFRLPSAIAALAMAIAATFFTTNVSGQNFPTRPPRFIVPFAPGGGADLNARRIGQRLEKIWGQPVVIQNMGGGGGNIAAGAAARSEPDGYTMFFASLPIFVNNPVIYSKLPFNPDRDFAPVVLMSETPHVLEVTTRFPATTVSELIALAKKRPGSLNFGSGGQGTSQHLAGELFKSVTGVNIVHVPYKGAGPAIAAMMGNEIQMLFDNASSALGHIRAGRLRGLAIASRNRAPALPQVPTFAESGVANFYTSIAYGIFVPAGTPASIVMAINRALNAAFKEPDYAKLMTNIGVNLEGGAPDRLLAFIREERKKWHPVIRSQGIRAY